MKRLLLIFILPIFLSACSTFDLAVDVVKDFRKSETPEPRYKIGNPYQINGIWYYPERDLNYDETGIASWYGDKFHGRLTANGEIFDANLISAAHKTLPMPSAVRVINLENGRSIILRVNDRGPFAAGRIIDLSREAARSLGFKEQGLARVRVQILPEESLRLEREARAGRFPDISQKISAKKPKTTPALVPTVSIVTSENSRVQAKQTKPQVSSLELLAANRPVEGIGALDTDIYIQVGSFQELSNAENMLGRLYGIDLAAISTFDNDGQLIHRVLIGPMNTVKDADDVLANIMSRGFRGARITLE